MISAKWLWFATVLFISGLLLFSLLFSATQSLGAPLPNATPGGQIATEVELAIAGAEWALSAHADTFDNGMGADTTCARCKSPFNWDPSQNLAQQEALDCGSCKRIPGAARPNLASGSIVKQTDWQNIACNVCHIPVGESYYTGIAFWNQAAGSYQAIEDTMELCGQCHEGQHGFEVVEEQETSQVHTDMQCTDCHGAHGSPSACQDCHDPTLGPGAVEHLRHGMVNCTACHDAGNLSIWYESDLSSPHYGEYITRRFAHTLTSWPSHNLQLQTRCERCHHPQGEYGAVVASNVSCTTCHPDGAALFWCENFPRNLDPNDTQDGSH